MLSLVACVTDQPVVKPSISNHYVDNKQFNYRKLMHKAKLGDVKAQYQLGRLLTHYSCDKFHCNDSAPYQPQQGRAWLTKAAKRGYHPAINLMSEITFDLHWMKIAAKHGNANAQYKLGTLYETGQKNVPYGDKQINIRKNYKTALKWFRRAAANGNTDAELEVAQLAKAGIT